MENMTLYEKFRNCPQDALKQIQGGKLRGKSDINPMWRIKVLTEAFGPQGIGWRLDNVRFWSEDAPNGEKMAFCSLDLVYKVDGEWCAPVPGIGGSGIVKIEKGILECNDEGYKMAMTDAISVAAKGLGVAADVYWASDRTKYSADTLRSSVAAIQCAVCGTDITAVTKRDGSLWKPSEMAAYSKQRYGKCLCGACMKKADKAAKEPVRLSDLGGAE